MEQGTFRIVEDDLTGEPIRDLLRRHAAGMLENSPPGGCHFLDLAGLQQSDVTVWSVWVGDQLAGCGALQEFDPRHGEVKSMRTADGHLGRGVGRAVLRHIIDEARARGYQRLSLETGRGPYFDAAIGLYESAGFEPCDAFGAYAENGFSRFYTLRVR